MFLVLALASAAPTAWSTYTNARFGYSVCYPSAFKAQREADSGDGRKFNGPNGAELSVFGRYTSDRGLDDWINDEASAFTGKRGRVTYRAGKANWRVLSGTDGARSQFYLKVVQRDDRFVTFQLSYPQSQATASRPVIEKLSRCLVVNKASF